MDDHGRVEKTMLLHRSKHIEALFYQGETDYLLITFGTMHERPDGESFWAKPVAEKARITTIGFMPTSPNWYPSSSIVAALPDLTPVIDRFHSIVLYGQSMGAYAALKHSRSLKASTVLAFSPQYSISPDDLSDKDPRYRSSYVSALHDGMAIKADDIAGRCFVFYDPYYKEDALNVSLIRNAAPGVHGVRVPWTHHFPIKLLRGTERTVRLLQACMAGQDEMARLIANEGRREAQIRVATACQAFALRGLETSIEMYQKRSSAFSQDDNIEFYIGLGRDALRSKDQVGAALALAQLLRIDSRREPVLKLWFNIAFYIKNLDESERVACLISNQYPDDVPGLCRMASLLLQNGRLDTAKFILDNVSRSDPDNTVAMRLLSLFWARRKNLAKALDLAERAVLLSPSDIALLCNLSHVQLQFGVPEEAERSAHAALALDPDHAGAKLRLSKAQDAQARHAKAARPAGNVTVAGTPA